MCRVRGRAEVLCMKAPAAAGMHFSRLKWRDVIRIAGCPCKWMAEQATQHYICFAQMLAAKRSGCGMCLPLLFLRFWAAECGLWNVGCGMWADQMRTSPPPPSPPGIAMRRDVCCQAQR